MSAKLYDWFEEKAKRLSLYSVTNRKSYEGCLTPAQLVELGYLRESQQRFARLQRQFHQQPQAGK